MLRDIHFPLLNFFLFSIKKNTTS